MEHITQPRPDPKRKDFFDYRKIRELRNNYLEQRGYGKEPEKFLVRSDHFLRLFNEDFNLKGDKAVGRRTLQFYSSPKVRLFPLPTYKDRHTAHYLFSDDYDRLGAIWTLRSKLFLPIEMVRTLLKLAGPDMYPIIIDWDETPEALIDSIMMDKAGYEPEDFHLYSAAKGLLDDEFLRVLRRDFSEAAAKKAMIKKLDEQYAGIKRWIESGRGIKFLTALADGRREFTDIRERLGQMTEEEAEEGGAVSGG